MPFPEKGQDCILRIWVLRDKHGYFSNMRRRYQVEHEGITEEQVVEDEVTQGYLNSPDSQVPYGSAHRTGTGA